MGDQSAIAHQFRYEGVVFLPGTVAPVDAVGPGKASNLLHPLTGAGSSIGNHSGYGTVRRVKCARIYEIALRVGAFRKFSGSSGEKRPKRICYGTVKNALYFCNRVRGGEPQVAGPVRRLRRLELAAREPRGEGSRPRFGRPGRRRDRALERGGGRTGAAHAHRPGGIRPRAGRGTGERLGGPAGRRSGHRQIDPFSCRWPGAIPPAGRRCT